MRSRWDPSLTFPLKKQAGKSVSDITYVNNLYQNVLGRDADTGGMIYWLGQLNSGAETRYELLLGFAESAENKALFTEMTGFGWVSELKIYICYTSESWGNLICPNPKLKSKTISIWQKYSEISPDSTPLQNLGLSDLISDRLPSNGFERSVCIRFSPF